MCRSTVTEEGNYTVRQDYCSSFVAVTKVPENLGDADGQGEVTSDDALAILKYAVGIPQEGFVAELADCDGVDGVTTDDALAVLRYIVGIIEELK